MSQIWKTSGADEPPPIHASDDPKFPNWLKSLVRACDGPSVAFAYDLKHQVTPTSVQQSRYTELVCSDSLGKPDRKALSSRYLFDDSFALYQEARNAQSPPHESGTTSHNIQWRSKAVDFPIEILENITKFLSVDDVKNFRLVCKEWEYGISASFFGTVVVAFNKEIYGSFAKHTYIKEPTNIPEHVGETKAPWPFKPQKTSKAPVRDIFSAFGEDIRRFGMSFDITEKEITEVSGGKRQPPQKTFWGEFTWPAPAYARFKRQVELEDMADEVHVMAKAFSKLTNVRHIALSVDAGLGRLNGPDLSVRAQVLCRQPETFQTAGYVTRTNVEAQRHLWSTIETTYRNGNVYGNLRRSEILDIAHESIPKLLTNLADSAFTLMPVRLLDNSINILAKDVETETDTAALRAIERRENELRLQWYANGRLRIRPVPPTQIISYPGLVHTNIGLVHTNMMIDEWIEDRLKPKSKVVASNSNGQDKELGDMSIYGKDEHNPRGVLLIKEHDQRLNEERALVPRALSPGNLTAEQLESLLESSWAQAAFLTSYMVAVIDNTTNFSNVRTLSLSRLSGKYLLLINESMFWDALSSLEQVEILVIPDWREIDKGPHDNARIDELVPSEIAQQFYLLLKDIVSTKPSINTLKIGWLNGGEHAEGCEARNRHVMPAPLLPSDFIPAMMTTYGQMLVLEHVKNLTLVNCWCTPDIFIQFVTTHEPRSLRVLTLESFSLCMLPLLAPLAQLEVPAGTVDCALVHNMLRSGISAEIVARGYSHQWYTFQKQFPLQAMAAALGSTTLRKGWPTTLSEINQAFYRGSRGRRGTPLQIAFLSCGYALLMGGKHEGEIHDHCPGGRDPRPAASALSTRIRRYGVRMMQRPDDPYLARVNDHFPEPEMDIMQNTWGMHRGWPVELDHVAPYDDEEGWGKWGEKTKEAPTFDGEHYGGTGRFSGGLILVGDERMKDSDADEGEA